ncbi:DEAD/DEAH box helicase [bacterium]|nr:DEAD/DEAH box helicase [bacterium]
MQQRAAQVIASIDYAKQDDVRERVWQQRWDLVIIDEAHKCSAYTKRSTKRGDEVSKTKRYQLAEHLALCADHLLLLTATPHHGDDDRFAHFVRLIDPDLFPEPHRLGERATELRREILRLGPECPWALRRLKEDLKDVYGRRLFPDRHAHTVTFRLNSEEYDLYKAVSAFINQFLPQATGRKQNSVALARTVFQRRLASSTMAIYESVRRRLERQQELLRELESLTPSQFAKRVAQLQGRLVDVEQDEDDLDDEARDRLIDEFTAALQLDQLRAEVAALQDLVAQARRVRDHASDSKLAALRECLERAEFRELQDGRGKLLIFTEHYDTVKYLCEQLERWGYTTCRIHGSMNPRERQRAQEEFRTTKQVCVATEAAGEASTSTLPPDDKLRPPMEPDAPGATPWPHPPHRPGARGPRLQLRLVRVRRGSADHRGTHPGAAFGKAGANARSACRPRFRRDRRGACPQRREPAGDAA